MQTHKVINDLQVPGEQMLKQWNGPLLKSFRKDGVVCEEERVGDDFPSFVPWYLLLINENTHQLRNSEGRVSIVELDGGI